MHIGKVIQIDLPATDHQAAFLDMLTHTFTVPIQAIRLEPFIMMGLALVTLVKTRSHRTFATRRSPAGQHERRSAVNQVQGNDLAGACIAVI
jgi:hypothetical protein